MMKRTAFCGSVGAAMTAGAILLLLGGCGTSVLSGVGGTDVASDLFTQLLGVNDAAREGGVAAIGFDMFDMHAGGFFANPLNLTDEQRAAAEDIRRRMHDDIEAIRDQAREDFRALLTEEQQAAFDALDTGRPMLPEGGFPMLHGGFGGPIGFGGMHRFGGMHHFDEDMHGPQHHDGVFIDHLADALDLTDEQVTAIEAIREAARTDIEARHDQAREEFRAILTDEQLATLDELEANRPFAEHCC